MLNKLHRYSAILLSCFIFMHLANHSLAFLGVDKHIELMKTLRVCYRNSIFEMVLIFCALFQVLSGIYFIKRRFKQREDWVDKTQAISGGYLAFFILNHLIAVFYGRAGLDLDTNFYYAATGMHVYPYLFFFIPYYILAVTSFFTHLGCAFFWITRNQFSVNFRKKVVILMILFGFSLGLFIVLTFKGSFFPIEIPQEYYKTFGK